MSFANLISLSVQLFIAVYLACTNLRDKFCDKNCFYLQEFQFQFAIKNDTNDFFQPGKIRSQILPLRPK